MPFSPADGLFDAFVTVLDEFTPFPGRIEAELSGELPFLTTTRLLVAAVKAGMGRETAHEIIKRHTLEAAAARRAGDSHDAWAALASDAEFPLDAAAIEAAAGDRSGLTGRADSQIDTIASDVENLIAQYPAAATYKPGTLL